MQRRHGESTEEFMKRLRDAREQRERHREIKMFAMCALEGMLSSAPIMDRTKVDKKTWVRQAFDWGEAMQAENERRRKKLDK